MVTRAGFRLLSLGFLHRVKKEHGRCRQAHLGFSPCCGKMSVRGNWGEGLLRLTVPENGSAVEQGGHGSIRHSICSCGPWDGRSSQNQRAGTEVRSRAGITLKGLPLSSTSTIQVLPPKGSATFKIIPQARYQAFIPQIIAILISRVTLNMVLTWCPDCKA